MSGNSAPANLVGELIVLCDASNVIRFVNNQFATLFGAAAEKWHGQNFISEKTPPQSGETIRFKSRAPTRDNEKLIEWRANRLTGGEMLFVGDVIDSPENIRSAPTEVTDAATGERTPAPTDVSSGAAESRYLATLSHEMRTPLNGILGMASLLLDSDLTLNQRAYVEAMRDSGSALLALVNDILDFSKLGAGKLEIEQAPFDPGLLIQNVTELLAPRAAEKQIEVLSFIDPALPRRLIGDEARIRQILINLVGNAVKFTDQGGVAIEATMRTDERGTPQFHLSVRDTGVGIPANVQKSIFDEFIQPDGDANRRRQGTGLGLTISKQLARVMNGDITLKSATGKGSVFTLVLPVTIAEESNFKVTLHRSPVVVCTRSAILAHVLQKQIKSLGAAECTVVSSTGDIAAATEGNAKALVLIDYPMTKEFENIGQLISCPSIVLLPHTARDAIPALRQKGVDSYLIKPIRLVTLAREINREALQGRSATFDTGQQAKEPTFNAKAVTASPAEPASGKNILLAEDNQINAVLATAILKRAGHRVVVAANGALALNALAEERFDIVLMDMHMPEVDGLDAARQIRKLETEVAALPIVALTANAMSSDRQRCIAAGMNDFLAKPFDPDELLDIVSKWSSNPGKAQKAAS